MKHEVLESAPELEALANRWSELAERGAVRTPFQSLAWLRHALAAAQPGEQPYIVHVPDAGIVAPFVRTRVAGIRVLRFLGNPASGYEQLVCSGDPAEAWRCVAELLARSDACDLVRLDFVPGGAAVARALAPALGGAPYRRLHEACPFADADCTWSEFAQRRSWKVEGRVRHWERNLARNGRGALRVQTLDCPLTPAQLAELADVEAHSWKWQRGLTLLQPGSGFLADFLADPAAPARVWLLRSGERPIAFAVLLSDAHAWYYYWPAYREDSRNSGSLLLRHIMAAACEGSCARVDLLRGDQSYKADWSDDKHSVDRIVWSNSAAGRLLASAYRTRWRAGRSALLRRLAQPFTGSPARQPRDLPTS